MKNVLERKQRHWWFLNKPVFKMWIIWLMWNGNQSIIDCFGAATVGFFSFWSNKTYQILYLTCFVFKYFQGLSASQNFGFYFTCINHTISIQKTKTVFTIFSAQIWNFLHKTNLYFETLKLTVICFQDEVILPWNSSPVTILKTLPPRDVLATGISGISRWTPLIIFIGLPS